MHVARSTCTLHLAPGTSHVDVAPCTRHVARGASHVVRPGHYNDPMRPLRFAALFALVVWVGGLLTLGMVAAPAVFDVLGATGSDGRTLAGAVFGETLRRFHIIAYACGTVLIGSLIARAILGPRPRPFGVRLAIATIMLAAAASTGLVVAPRIEQARHEIGASVS